MADIFSLQDDVNREIVAKLKVNLTPTEEERLVKVETVNPDAYDMLLRGLQQYTYYSRESMVTARELFKQAVALDPNYARAYSNIALTYGTEINFYWTPNREESIRLGLEYANKALQLDDSIPQIYLTRSILYLSQRQHEAAREAAMRTIEVFPDYADGHAALAFVLSYSGQYEQALKALERAKQLNIEVTGVYFGVEGRIFFLMGRYTDALASLEKSIELNPGFDRTHLTLAAVLVRLGRLDDAAWSVEEALAISPEVSLAKERREANYLHEADLENYLDALRDAGVPE
jgi:adenylate cyclase